MSTRRGEWYVVTQAILVLALLLAPLAGARLASYRDVLTALGAVLGALGLIVVIISSIALGRHQWPLPIPKAEASLVRKGPFSLVRHPIYSGVIFFAFGWCLFWGSVPALFIAVLILIFFDVKTRREERWLEAKFAEYAAYKSRVHKFIPFIY